MANDWRVWYAVRFPGWINERRVGPRTVDARWSKGLQVETVRFPGGGSSGKQAPRELVRLGAESGLGWVESDVASELLRQSQDRQAQ